MSKTESDSLKKIDTQFLKRFKYLTGGLKGGEVNWTSNGVDTGSSVGIEVSTQESYLRIYYTQTERHTEEKKKFDYKIPLTTTPCNYGGKRYWFTCPWYKSNNYCGKRVGTLYKDGDYFACRHCYNLTYSSRNLSGISKTIGNISNLDVENARKKVKTKYYKGKYTKKYLNYLKKRDKLDNAFILMSDFLIRTKRVRV